MRLFPHSEFYKIYVSIAFFIVILLVGTVGYVLIEDYPIFDALYMTVITLATVGYGETHPLSDTGRLFTMFLILANIGTFTYFITQVSSYFLDGEFIRTYKHVRMINKIHELHGHVIICGYGRDGTEAARVIESSGLQYVVIEQATQARDLSHLTYHVEGDAIHDDVLIEAGVKHASALITTLPEDADNLFVVLTARALNPNIKIISRASRDTTVAKLKTAGASNVIMPDKIGGTHMASLLVRPDVNEFVDVMSSTNSDSFQLTEVVASKTTTVGQLDCWKSTGATLLGIKNRKGDYILNPNANHAIAQGDILIVMGAKDQVAELRKLLGE
jgi:voltage-gated potassium channel